MLYKQLLLIFITVCLVSCKQQTEQSEIVPKTLLDSAIVAHGGQRYDGATIAFELNKYQFKLKRQGYNYNYEMSSDLEGDLHKVETFNGGVAYYVNDSLTDKGGRAETMLRNRINDVAYDFYIPSSLSANDVVLTYLGQEPMRLRPYHKLKVTYKQIEGAAPDLRAYVLWIDVETYEIDFIAKQNEQASGRKQFMAAAYKRKVGGMLFSDYELYQTAGRNTEVSLDSLGIAYNAGLMQRQTAITYQDIEVSLSENN